MPWSASSTNYPYYHPSSKNQILSKKKYLRCGLAKENKFTTQMTATPKRDSHSQPLYLKDKKKEIGVIVWRVKVEKTESSLMTIKLKTSCNFWWRCAGDTSSYFLMVKDVKRLEKHGKTSCKQENSAYLWRVLLIYFDAGSYEDAGDGCSSVSI